MPMQFKQQSQGSYSRMDSSEKTKLRERNPGAATLALWLLGMGLPLIAGTLLGAFSGTLERTDDTAPLRMWLGAVATVLLLVQIGALWVAIEFWRSGVSQLRKHGIAFVATFAVLNLIGLALMLIR